MKPLFLFAVLTVCITITSFSQSIMITKQRPAQLELPTYKKIVIGDIVNATGMKDKNALDLTDEITSRIFNSGTFEVVDKSTLNSILSSQKGGNVETVNEQTISALSKKMNDALMILGRIQSSDIRQENISTDHSSGDCKTMYHWKVSGNMTIQLKMIDIKTGKLLYSNQVIAPADMESKETCTPTEKFQTAYIEQKTIPDLASRITKLFIPYSEDIYLIFEKGTLFKNPFKKDLDNAITMINIKNYDGAIAILKPYTENTSLKDVFKGQAWGNYANALYAAGRYDEAKEAYKTAITFTQSATYSELYSKMDEEKQTAMRMAKK